MIQLDYDPERGWRACFFVWADQKHHAWELVRSVQAPTLLKLLNMSSLQLAELAKSGVGTCRQYATSDEGRTFFAAMEDYQRSLEEQGDG